MRVRWCIVVKKASKAKVHSGEINESKMVHSGEIKMVHNGEKGKQNKGA